MFGGKLDWPPETILTLIGLWGVVVARGGGSNASLVGTLRWQRDWFVSA